MAAEQGLFSFPGVGRYTEARFTLQHGISPSVCTLTMVPQPGFTARGGLMRFRFGGTVLSFPDCIVDQHEIVTGDNGQLWQLTIFDRRWRWAFGEISGTYNLRTDDGKLIKSTEKRPQELCAMLLKAMGEGRFDISRVPNDSRPAVEWDYDNPAEALAELCDELRCRVVLQLDNSVALYPIGYGRQLPVNLSVIDDSLSIDPPELPSSIKIVGGKSRYEVSFELEAVGEDRDGSIVPIDDLKYKPTGGWDWIDIPNFQQIASESDRSLAKKSVFRWYRVKVGDDDPTIPGWNTTKNKKHGDQIDALWQILPLEDEKVETQVLAIDGFGLSIDPDGVNRNAPATLHGVWWAGDDNYTNSVNPPVNPNASGKSLYKGDFRIRSEIGVVELSQPLVQLEAQGNNFLIKPASLVLRAACSARDPKTRAYHRYTRERRLGNFGTGAKIIQNDDLVLGAIPKYTESSLFIIKSVATNQDDLDREADKLLDQAVREIEVSFPYSRTYAGLFPISPDGAIQQVTWAVTESGAFTQASRNYENSVIGNLPYTERRNLERDRGQRRRLRKLTSAHRAREARKPQVN